MARLRITQPQSNVGSSGTPHITSGRPGQCREAAGVTNFGTLIWASGHRGATINPPTATTPPQAISFFYSRRHAGEAPFNRAGLARSSPPKNYAGDFFPSPIIILLVFLQK